MVSGRMGYWWILVVAEGYLSPNTKVGDEMRRYGMCGRKQ
jgi:hypothetical protein